MKNLKVYVSKGKVQVVEFNAEGRPVAVIREFSVKVKDFEIKRLLESFEEDEEVNIEEVKLPCVNQERTTKEISEKFKTTGVAFIRKDLVDLVLRYAEVNSEDCIIVYSGAFGILWKKDFQPTTTDSNEAEQEKQQHQEQEEATTEVIE